MKIMRYYQIENFKKTGAMTIFLFFAMFLIIASPLFAEERKEVESLKQGINYFSAGNYKKAIKVFEQAARVNPDSAEAYKWLGMSYLKLGDNEIMTDPEMLDKAMKAFDKALSLNPNFAEARYYLGITYLALYNKDAAVREYDILKDIDKELASSLFARIGNYRSPQAYKSIGETESNVLKVKIIDNQVLVPVTLGYGGKTVQALLLLDTGATNTTISPEIAAKLNISLDQTKKTIGQVVGGGLLEAKRVKLNYIKVGPHTKTDIDIDIIEHIDLASNFDGLLGMNFLRNFRYHINFDNQTINWAP
jgi:clan AA aspartic protease (TIGR02281 family)